MCREVDGAIQGLTRAADLSDRTFKALDEKAARLRKLKVSRLYFPTSLHCKAAAVLHGPISLKAAIEWSA